jgi:hypothetical protein
MPFATVFESRGYREIAISLHAMVGQVLGTCVRVAAAAARLDRQHHLAGNSGNRKAILAVRGRADRVFVDARDTRRQKR